MTVHILFLHKWNHSNASEKGACSPRLMRGEESKSSWEYSKMVSHPVLVSFLAQSFSVGLAQALSFPIGFLNLNEFFFSIPEFPQTLPIS
jgi:hypothetical protein